MDDVECEGLGIEAETSRGLFNVRSVCGPDEVCTEESIRFPKSLTYSQLLNSVYCRYKP